MSNMNHDMKNQSKWQIGFLHKKIIILARVISQWLIELMVLFAIPKVFKMHRNVVFFTRDKKNVALDIFQPDSQDLAPIVMMIHGGGFVGGDKRHIERSSRLFAQQGFLVFNINYRLAPEHAYPVAIQDCEDAFAWIKKNASQYRGDISRVCVGGASAGAYLAACLAINKQSGKQESDFSAVLLLNGCFDVDMTYHSQFPQAKFLVKCFLQEKTHDKETRHQASPLNFINEQYPKTFIGVGSKDSLLEQSHALRDKLQACKVSVSYYEYLDSNHGWFSWFWTNNAKQAHQDMLSWLKQAV